MKYLTLVLIVIAMGAQAQSAIPISGDYCPAFYDKKGDMCVPTKEATVAIVKDGECPEKMIPVGNYCITPDRVTTIIPPQEGLARVKEHHHYSAHQQGTQSTTRHFDVPDAIRRAELVSTLWRRA